MNASFKILFFSAIISCTSAFSQNIPAKSLVGEILSGYKECESKINLANLSGLSLRVSQETKRLGGAYSQSQVAEFNRSEDDFKKSIDSIIECADNLKSKSDSAFKNSLEKQPTDKDALMKLKILAEKLTSIFANPPVLNTSAAWDLYQENVRRQGAPFKRAAMPLANAVDIILLDIYFK